jgi:hypothetical protein
MTSQPVAEDATSNAPAPLCEECGQPFTERKGTGGKPQRFCSPECRTTYHSENRQRDQRSPTCSERAVTPVTPVAKPTPTTKEVPQRAYEEDVTEFDWNDEDTLVLRRQFAVAVYRTPDGSLVIRQERDWNEEDDTCIVISPENVGDFVDRLTDAAGIPTVGGPKVPPPSVRRR